MYDKNSLKEALKQRRMKGVDLSIIIGDPEVEQESAQESKDIAPGMPKKMAGKTSGPMDPMDDMDGEDGDITAMMMEKMSGASPDSLNGKVLAEALKRKPR